MKKMMRVLAVSVLGLCVSVSAMAGVKIRVVDGSLSGLTDHKKVKVQYIYDGMTIGQDRSETDYVDEKVAEKNESKPGEGDKWKDAWIGNRARNFQPRFEELINKYMADSGVFLSSEQTNPDLLMVVQITRIEPGFYSYVVNRKASLDLKISFSDPTNPANVSAVVVLTGAPGTAYPSVSKRVGESFAKAGKDFGKFLEKKTQ